MYLTISAVAQRLAVSQATVRRLMIGGDLRYIRIRRAIRISEVALGNYLCRCESQGIDGLSNSCSAESGYSADSPQAEPKPTHNSLKASSVVKSLMRLT